MPKVFLGAKSATCLICGNGLVPLDAQSQKICCKKARWPVYLFENTAISIMEFSVLKSTAKEKNKMATSIEHLSKWTMVALFGLSFGIVWDARAADPTVNQNGPMIKNLMALTYRAPAARPAVAHELTGKEVRELTATPKSAEDHLKLARYYRAEADRLDAQGAAYEEAAAAYRHGPIVKNIMAPNTPARYDFIAKGFREKAKSDLSLAASHEQMAKSAAPSL